MSTIVEAIRALRDAIAAAANADHADVGAAVDPAWFTAAQVVTVPGGRAVDHVSVRPVRALELGELEPSLGPFRRLPRGSSGGPITTVLFAGTLPAEGSSGTTVLADVDKGGRVERLVFRADAF